MLRVKIGKDSVVAFDFVMTDEEGTVIDEGAGEDGMRYLHGQGQIPPGLERALEGKQVGDKLDVTIAPEDAFGERSESEDLRVPRGELPEEMPIEPGAELVAENDGGEQTTFWVVDVENGWVTLTRDHPLSGLTVKFAVTVTEVRDATEEEVAHGHVHGAGGHSE